MSDDKHLRRALSSALNLISYRQRTEKELRERLAPRFDREIIDSAIERLKDQYLVDDASFARAWRDGRMRKSPRSSAKIVSELTGKGVERHVAEAAVADLDDELTATEAASSFARRLADADYEGFHRRLWGHLRRRGYSGSVARGIMRDLWEERDQA